jgi:quercetin dioxygenase-like cupin family protein
MAEKERRPKGRAEPAMWHEKPGAWREVLPGVRRRILTHSPAGMMVLYKIDPGCVFPRHNHTHAQYGIFLEGGGDFKVGEKVWKISRGDSYFIPPGIYHELKTDSKLPSVVVDFFTPAREDYLKEALPPDQA